MQAKRTFKEGGRIDRNASKKNLLEWWSAFDKGGFLPSSLVCLCFLCFLWWWWWLLWLSELALLFMIAFWMSLMLLDTLEVLLDGGRLPSSLIFWHKHTCTQFRDTFQTTFFLSAKQTQSEPVTSYGKTPRNGFVSVAETLNTYSQSLIITHFVFFLPLFLTLTLSPSPPPPPLADWLIRKKTSRSHSPATQAVPMPHVCASTAAAVAAAEDCKTVFWKEWCHCHGQRHAATFNNPLLAFGFDCPLCVCCKNGREKALVIIIPLLPTQLRCVRCCIQGERRERSHITTHISNLLLAKPQSAHARTA